MQTPGQTPGQTPVQTPVRPAHGLGPHVVGLRVVVRRVLPGETGPSGGPAMTDLLGVCTAWGDGRCVVQPESGPPVTIALSDIVSGKPVPPRPSVRHRVPPREAQHRAFALFDDLETAPLGDWVLRRSPGHRARRANSVLAFGPSGVDDDVAAVVDFYDRPIAAVLLRLPRGRAVPLPRLGARERRRRHGVHARQRRPGGAGGARGRGGSPGRGRRARGRGGERVWPSPGSARPPPASRRTATTGSASAASRSTRAPAGRAWAGP